MRTSSAVDRAAQQLRRLIFDGVYPSGSSLREVALAETLGVARSTIREALGVLVSEGVAVREPHRGVSVARLEPAIVSDVMRARTVLEEAGVRRWAEAEEAARDAVRKAVAEYVTAADSNASYSTLNEAHLRVHNALVGLTGSSRLIAMGEALISELRVVLAETDRVRDDAHAEAGSHAHLLELLEAGDPAAVADELAHHLSEAEVALTSALRRGRETG